MKIFLNEIFKSLFEVVIIIISHNSNNNNKLKMKRTFNYCLGNTIL